MQDYYVYEESVWHNKKIRPLYEIHILQQHWWQVQWLPSLIPQTMDDVHSNKPCSCPYLVYLPALPINATDSLTMSNKYFKNTHILWCFIYCFALIYDFH